MLDINFQSIHVYFGMSCAVDDATAVFSPGVCVRVFRGGDVATLEHNSIVTADVNDV